VVDRNNGKLQNAFPFVDNITWASHIDLKTGRPVENPGQRPAKPLPGETKGKPVEVSPPFLGGKNWNPMAYSQDTGLFYVPGNQWKEDTGPRKSVTRKARPTWAWASASSVCMTITSAACGR
jgi:alcohol dehydrogenase (cytochrome c)